MIEVVIHTPEASLDVAESYGWYESRESGLGEEFLRCVEACILLIQRHPEMFPPAVDEFRRALIRRFPFEIFYEASVERIVIYAVFHCSRSPKTWRQRLTSNRKEGEPSE